MPVSEPPVVTHTQLLHQIKEIANERGFFAQIEAPVLDGKGRIEIALERGGLKIAVEVSLENKLTDEMSNVRKCLNAGFEHICLVTPSVERNEKLALAVAAQFQSSEQTKVRVLLPEGFADYLDRF